MEGEERSRCRQQFSLPLFECGRDTSKISPARWGSCAGLETSISIPKPKATKYSPSLAVVWVSQVTTLSQSNLLKLHRAQNGAMRAILGTTKDTPIEAMRYLLGLPSKEARHNGEQVKAHLNAMKNPKNPLHDGVKEGCRLARGKSWMGPVEQSTHHMCDLTELKQIRDWGNHPIESKSYYETLLPENLGNHCRKWPARKAIVNVRILVETNSKPHDIMMYTDGSVTRDRSGCWFTVRQGGRTVHDDSIAHRVRSPV